MHWDGKMVPALSGKENVEHLAVIVSGSGVMKLLGVSIVTNRTGKAHFKLIDEWHLNDRI